MRPTGSAYRRESRAANGDRGSAAPRRFLVTDARIQGLSRRHDRDDPLAEAKLLRERLRIGALRTRDLQLAAYLRHPPARIALGAEAPTPHRNLSKLRRGLVRFGHGATIRAACAVGVLAPDLLNTRGASRGAADLERALRASLPHLDGEVAIGLAYGAWAAWLPCVPLSGSSRVEGILSAAFDLVRRRRVGAPSGCRRAPTCDGPVLTCDGFERPSGADAPSTARNGLRRTSAMAPPVRRTPSELEKETPMRRPFRTFASFSLLFVAAVAGAQDAGLPGGPVPSADEAPAEVSAEEVLVAGNNAFAIDLYKQLKEQPGNKFLSPYSISTALAMTYAGARGRTAADMAEVLRFDSLEADALHAAFGALQRRLNGLASQGAQEPTDGISDRLGGGSSDAEGQSGPDASADGAADRGYQLSVANALWAQEGFPFRPAYTALVRSRYGAPVEPMDFLGDADGSRETINAWVEDATEDKIQDLLKPGMIDASTRLVLTNAIYFKGSWKTQFDPEDTEDGDFTRADGSVVEVPLMHRFTDTDQVRYTESADLGAKLVELPYEGDDASMLVILPTGDRDLGAVEDALGAEALAAATERMWPSDVQLTLPRFEMTSEFDLGTTLGDMGMASAFDPGSADFSGMSEESLAISSVVHKAFVKVDEAGTEAAAATAVAVLESMSIPREFRADRPFLFLIRDGSGAILFIGRVEDPSAGE